MRTSSRVFALISAAILGFGAQAVFAQATIKSVTAEPNRAVLVDGKATIRLTVDGDAPENSNCGIIIDYSGDTSDNRKINKKDGLLPRVVEHVFTRAGVYEIKARGGRVASTLACNGKATAQVIVTDSPKAAAMPAPGAPAAMSATGCYRGWRYSQSKADKKSGAFTCKPRRTGMQAPEKRIECPAGLTYFEKGATYGCSL